MKNIIAMSLALGITLAFITMLCWGFGDFLIQKSARKFGDVETLFLISFFGAIVLLPFIYGQLNSIFTISNLIILSITSVVMLIGALLDFEALKKGKSRPSYAQKGETQFCNFILEDDSDFITIRVSPKSYKRFGKLIFEELKENDVIMVKGRIGSGIRMVFANYIVKLEDTKNKIENKVKLTSTEEELFKV